jgi:hypothetical protein
MSKGNHDPNKKDQESESQSRHRIPGVPNGYYMRLLIARLISQIPLRACQTVAKEL